MTATVLDGKKLAATMREDIRTKVAALTKATGVTPGLAVILVGENPASVSYVTSKEKACQSVGIRSFDNRLPETTTQEELLALVETLNHDAQVHGILVQLPLPRHIDEQAVIRAISPEKDVDGFHPLNVGKMMLGEPCFLPCTPHGIVKMLQRAGVQVAGAHAVVVGRSNIVGKPVANMLLQKSELGNATVTLCHTQTRNLGELTRQADILIVASGHPNTVTADMVKQGAVVIDVGVNRIPADTPRGYRLVGDVDFEGVCKVASVITPVPGGVGPMTITMLLENTVQAACQAAGRGEYSRA